MSSTSSTTVDKRAVAAGAEGFLRQQRARHGERVVFVILLMAALVSVAIATGFERQMGVLKRLQSSRMASQLAFMMIEYIRRNAISHYGASRGEIGWILDDNQGMNAIAEAINSHINKDYWLYDKAL